MADQHDDNVPTALTATDKRFLAGEKALASRCNAAGLSHERVELFDDEIGLSVNLKQGRNTRPVTAWTIGHLESLISIPFEEYVFLTDYEAICSYSKGTIEAGLRPLSPGGLPLRVLMRRLFGDKAAEGEDGKNSERIVISAEQDDLPTIEISPASRNFSILVNRPNLPLTLKLSNCRVSTHDGALNLLKRLSDTLLFQLDLLTDLPMSLARLRRISRNAMRSTQTDPASIQLQYPKTELDSAPLSLYWYARSASGMPLLQFLAFYQVIEFYFPVYSQSEARRKLKGILKDPTFRGDKDADIAKLLGAIQVTRSGSFGDERSQLRTTLVECVDLDSLRAFLTETDSRHEFFTSKSKTLPYHRVPLANPSADLRNDVAERVYDIRCKIVHTKPDARDATVELLLPFSKEAEQLSFDIDLMQYLAQQVLIAGSTSLSF